MRFQLLVAQRAPQAGLHMLLFPTHCAAGSGMLVQQLLQMRALGLVDRDQVVNRVAHHRAVAQDQFSNLGPRYPGSAQGVGIGGQLQQRAYLG